MKPKIIVFGTVCLDRLRHVDSLPDIGGYVETLPEALKMGGEAANTAYALTVWQAPVLLQGNPIGDDYIGQVLWELLQETPLDLSATHRQSGFTTPVCDIYVTPDGKRTMFGQNFTKLQKCAFVDIDLSGIEWFTADMNPGAASIAACEKAKSAGAKVLMQDFIQHDGTCEIADIWLSSTDWTGFSGDAASLKDWAYHWAKQHSCSVIVTDGVFGGVFVEKPSSVPQCFSAYAIDNIQDTTGAGDAFRAGLLFGLWKKWDYKTAIEFASAAAGLNCTEFGAVGGIKTYSDIIKFMKEKQDIAWT